MANLPPFLVELTLVQQFLLIAKCLVVLVFGLALSGFFKGGK